MKFFKSIQSFEDLKTQYKKLAINNHPDNGGNIENMQEINAEYDQLFPVWKRKSNITTTETSFSTRSEFYTSNGWKGHNYNGNLSTTAISKIIKTYCKEMYPTWKFSVTSEYFSGGSAITVAIMEAPFDIFNRETTGRNTYWDIDSDNVNIQLHRVTESQKKYFNEAAYMVIKDVYDFMQSYNFDDSDVMTDYFSVNFYSHYNIGKWNKGFKVVEKTARIKHKKSEITPSSAVILKTTETQTYDFTISKDIDTRDNSPLYAVKCNDPLDKNEYIKLNQYIKSIGGYYSKFKHAFLFREDPSNKLGVNN